MLTYWTIYEARQLLLPRIVIYWFFYKVILLLLPFDIILYILTRITELDINLLTGTYYSMVP